MDQIDIYLSEDLGKQGDITSDSLFTDEQAEGNVISRQACVIAGVEEIKKVFNRTGAKFVADVDDGDLIKKNQKIAEVKGPIRSILIAERLALNILGRMSGIATETKKLVDLCKPLNQNIRIAATRKTTPGFRYFEKKAVEIAGGDPHRFGLFDAVMIKDNHLKKFESVEIALEKVKQKVRNKIIEIEVENEKDAISAANFGVDVIMLDNMAPKIAEEIANIIRKINKDILIEISGGITADNILDYASFSDRISLGYLTNSIKTIDFSLEIK